MIPALHVGRQRTCPNDGGDDETALDRAVDRLYRKEPFASDKERPELLFERYRELVDV